MRKTIFCISCLFLILGAFLAYKENVSGATVVIVAGLACFTFANLERFELIKAWKFEAKLWKDKNAEVDETLKYLRETAAVTSHAVLTDLMAGNYLGGMSLAKKFEIHKNIIFNLKATGANEEQVSLAEKDWKKGVGILYMNLIRHVLEERTSKGKINPDLPKNKKEASDEIWELLNFEDWKAPNPQEMRSVLKKHAIEDPTTESWINDYEHFINDNEILRIEEFTNEKEG
jgi:hypothetical protein